MDGVAASMGSVIAMSGKPLFMNRYSRLMIHRITGSSYGNADDMEEAGKVIMSLESDLISIVSEKTGISVDDVKARWFDGKDHWFTAQQALDAGFVSGIFDGVKPAVLPKDNVKASALYQVYNALLNPHTDMNKLFKSLALQARQMKIN
ncbi:MAG: ATP-dependent Clp protease proteolytic subunit [Bacteroidales bacterium]